MAWKGESHDQGKTTRERERERVQGTRGFEELKTSTRNEKNILQKNNLGRFVDFLIYL